MKEKIKEFYGRHEVGCTIAMFVGAAAVGILTGKAINHVRMKHVGRSIQGDKIIECLDDVRRMYACDGECVMFVGSRAEGLVPSELGELGERLIKAGSSAEGKFTHFIAFGKKQS